MLSWLFFPKMKRKRVMSLLPAWSSIPACDDNLLLLLLLLFFEIKVLKVLVLIIINRIRGYANNT